MVDLGPLDADAIRALVEAAKFGRSLFDSDAKPKEEQTEAEDSSEPKESTANDPRGRTTPSDINNPTIGPGGIIGNVTVNNLYFDTSGRKLEMATETPCCHDYPDGLCPHRRQ